MKTITASERMTLIRLASTLPVGDDTRKAILQGLAGLKNLGETREASVREASAREAGRGWGCEKYDAEKKKCETHSDSASQLNYDIPPANNGTGAVCQPTNPDGDCYRSHHEYGKAPRTLQGARVMPVRTTSGTAKTRCSP